MTQSLTQAAQFMQLRCHNFFPGARRLTRKGATMQRGSLFQSTRQSGQIVREYRWRDRSSGTPVYRRIVIGTIQEYPAITDARSAVHALLLENNTNNPRLLADSLTMSQLVEHYRQRELDPDNTRKSCSTKQAYAIYLRRWIVPRWGTCRLGTINPVAVETWLRQLPLARGARRSET
jgi:integrase